MIMQNGTPYAKYAYGKMTTATQLQNTVTRTALMTVQAATVIGGLFLRPMRSVLMRDVSLIASPAWALVSTRSTMRTHGLAPGFMASARAFSSISSSVRLDACFLLTLVLRSSYHALISSWAFALLSFFSVSSFRMVSSNSRS